MDASTFVAVIGGAVGLVGGLAGILSWLNQRKQTTVLQGQLDVMRQQSQSAKLQEDTTTEWAQNFDAAAKAIQKISPIQLTIGPSKFTPAYQYVFKDEDLRRRIPIYLGRQQFWTNKFLPATLGREQLQNPVVQRTIQDVLEAVNEFKRDHTDFARTLKLL